MRASCACLVLLLVAFLTLPASAGESSSSAPGSNTIGEVFVVVGKITAPPGKPLASVEVSASCGLGTLFKTGSSVSDSNGDYRLVFGPGVLMGRSLRAGESGVGFQAATIYAHKPGFYSKNLGRAGNLAMTDSTNTPSTWPTNFAGVVMAHKPYRLDFTLEPVQ